MKLHSVFLAVSALLSSTLAEASDTRILGQQLLMLCKANMGGGGNSIDAAECLGFVVGVAGTFDCEESNHGFRWNSSASVSQPRLAALVIQYLETHPKAQKEEAHLAIGAALQEAFPCLPKAASN